MNTRDANGQTPLHEAARHSGWAEPIDPSLPPVYGSTAVVEVLLAAGSSVEARSDGGWTPLHRAAARNQNPAGTEVLLAAGADVTERTDDGRTPLDLATGRAKRETRELLRAHQRDRR